MSIESTLSMLESFKRMSSSFMDLYRELVDVRAQLESMKWVSVSDRLPVEHEQVLAWIEGTGPVMAYTHIRLNGLLVWNCSRYGTDDDNGFTVTHWMPIFAPDYPEENPHGSQ